MNSQISQIQNAGKDRKSAVFGSRLGMVPIAAVVLVATLGVGGPALAARGSVCKDGSAPPCGGGGNKPPVGEIGANNLSFPVIFSDNLAPSGFPQDGEWRFAEINDPLNECIGEVGVPEGTPVPPEYLCYNGREVTVVAETGEIVFTGDPKTWWLQKRTQNFWKTLSVGHDVSTPLVVSAVDVGDLLESSPAIQARRIRVEFNLLQNVPATDPELGQYVVGAWDSGVPAPCALPSETGDSLGCFAALDMSGAVPGTQQSGNEIQGTEFSDSQTLLDPAVVRTTDPDIGGVSALVYSRCARLVIQKITGNASWDETLGQWSGAGVGAPVVDIAAYTDDWATEITSGGSIVYGYNWNAKTASTGDYRLTLVLDGNDDEGPQCSTQLATRFETGSTQLVNLGETNFPEIVMYGDSDLGDEGGLAYIDLTLSAKGGGGKKNQ